MITFIYYGSIPRIQDAAAAAAKVLADDNFYRLIAQKQKFKFCNGTAEQVAKAIKNCNLHITINTYKAPFGALGKEKGDPTNIYINIAPRIFNGRTVPDIANTLIHEAVHAADSDNELLDFHHDDNTPKGKGDTAPYWIGFAAELLIEKTGSVVTVQSIDKASHDYCG